jgi:hypothetical protein
MMNLVIYTPEGMRNVGEKTVELLWKQCPQKVRFLLVQENQLNVLNSELCT